MTGNGSPSLRSFLEQLDAKAPDQIWRVRDEVDRDYDVAAIISELERRGEYPVLWFDRVRGSRFPLVTNLFADRRRYAMALGVAPEALAEEWVVRGERRIPPVLRSSLGVMSRCAPPDGATPTSGAPDAPLCWLRS